MLIKEIAMKFNNIKKVADKDVDLTIIVNSCDNYKDVRILFKSAFNEFWPDNHYDLIYNHESSKILSYTDIEKENKKWGARLIDILNKVETTYVMILFDDYVLEDYVDNEKIYMVLSVLKSDDESSVFYLNSACVKDHIDDPINDYRLLKDRVDYRLNSVPSIWKKKDLILNTRKYDNPWSWEIFGSYRTFNNNKNFYSSSSQKNNIYKYNHQKGGAIYRGKWVKEVVEKKIKKYNLDIDTSIRGYVNFNDKVKRSFWWKFNFVMLGIRAIRFNMIIYFYRYFKLKFNSQK